MRGLALPGFLTFPESGTTPENWDDSGKTEVSNLRTSRFEPPVLGYSFPHGQSRKLLMDTVFASLSGEEKNSNPFPPPKPECLLPLLVLRSWVRINTRGKKSVLHQTEALSSANTNAFNGHVRAHANYRTRRAILEP